MYPLQCPGYAGQYITPFALWHIHIILFPVASNVQYINAIWVKITAIHILYWGNTRIHAELGNGNNGTIILSEVYINQIKRDSISFFLSFFLYLIHPVLKKHVLKTASGIQISLYALMFTFIPGIHNLADLAVYFCFPYPNFIQNIYLFYIYIYFLLI